MGKKSVLTHATTRGMDKNVMEEQRSENGEWNILDIRKSSREQRVIREVFFFFFFFLMD